MLLYKNPVLRRELQKRAASVFGAISTVFWLAALMLVLSAVYFSTKTAEVYRPQDLASLGQTGKALFDWILFFMLLFVLFIVPGVTSSTISGERERQTLIPLQLTLLSPLEIIVGKLTAALAFLALLMITAAPLLSVSFLLGGVRVQDVAVGLLMVLFTGLVLGSFGMLCSSFFKNTVIATVATYAISLAFLGGVWGYILVVGVFFQENFLVPTQVLALNPLTGIGDLFPEGGGDYYYDGGGPFSSVKALISEFQVGVFSESATITTQGRSWVWQLYILAGLFFLGVNTWLSTRSIRVPADRER